MELTRAERNNLLMASAGLKDKDLKLFQKYFRTGHWLKTKAAKLVRDSTCQLCRRMKATQVHHKSYACFYQERLDRDLDSVCSRCHRKISK